MQKEFSHGHDSEAEAKSSSWVNKTAPGVKELQLF